MKRLTAVDCLWPRVKRVLEEERPGHEPEGTLFAVFTDAADGAEVFCGLASERDSAAHPHWIFADLVEHRPLFSIGPKTALSACLGLIKKSQLEGLPVLDETGQFIGVVTQSSLLRGLLQQQRFLLRQARHYCRLAETERDQLARWSARLTELHEASRALLAVLAHSNLEKDLLQRAIDALTKLLEARYGAIGLLDQEGVLTEFVSVGISDEIARLIDQKPAGSGLLGLVIREDTAIRLEDLSTHPQAAGFPPHHPPMKSLLAVPVSHNRRVYGRIYLCDKWDGEPFTAEDELLAMSFAHSLSLILDNAREREEILKAQASLNRLAHYDPLTGLPNRQLANDRLQQVLAHTHRQGGRAALFFIDLDNFKQTNDSFGHSVGDGLLQAVAVRLLGRLRESDGLARLSGDEFLLLLPDITDIPDAAAVAEKILAALAAPFRIGRYEVFVTASIGISIFPDDAEDREDLLRFADTAMFHAKQGGRNGYRFFTEAMNGRIRHYSQIENALRHALTSNELELHYQPQVVARSGRIVGMEALLRWHSPALGGIPPAEFIPIAESSGLIGAVGEWALLTACVQGKRWADMNLGDLRLAVNVSALQLKKKGFVARVSEILAASGLPPGRLELEITESAMIDGTDEAVAVLEELHALGIRIAIDDFGTGYSSLSRLKKLPIGMLKIDKSFVAGVTVNADDAAIAVAIITLGHSLHLQVIAEGVETKAQLDFMIEHGCDEVQGYLLSKPLPVDDCTRLLYENRWQASLAEAACDF